MPLEERYIRFALSLVRLVELDQLTGQLAIHGLDTGVPLTASETQELAQFLGEHKELIVEIGRETAV